MNKISFNRTKGSFEGLTDQVLSDLSSRYSNVDVDRELERMRIWLLSEKGKRRAGTLSFIESWLGRAPETKKIVDEIVPAEIQGYLTQYLIELWKTTNITKINRV